MFVLYLFCVVEDAGDRAIDQEQMGELGFDNGDDVFVRRWEEACDLVEG